MNYIAKTKVETINKDTVLQPEDFGGWDCVNEGDTVCVVNGVELDPYGTIVARSFTDMHPKALWGEPIRITFKGAGTNRLIVTRLKYTETK